MVLPTPLDELRLFAPVDEEEEGAAEGEVGGVGVLERVVAAAAAGAEAVVVVVVVVAAPVEAGNRAGAVTVVLLAFPGGAEEAAAAVVAGAAAAAVPDFCQLVELWRVAFPDGRAVPPPPPAALGSVEGRVVIVVALTDTGWREGEGTAVAPVFSCFFTFVGGGNKGWRWR